MHTELCSHLKLANFDCIESAEQHIKNIISYILIVEIILHVFVTFNLIIFVNDFL